jgi:hypothetical protein
MSQITKGHFRGPLFKQALAQIAKGDGLFRPKVDFMNDAARILFALGTTVVVAASAYYGLRCWPS